MKTKTFKLRIIPVILLLFGLCLVSCNNDDDGGKTNPKTNTPPEAFSLIGVTNGASSVDVYPSFSWQAATDADGDPVTYDIYVDIAENPSTLYAENITTTNFVAIERLNTYTKYYWKVVAKDTNQGIVSSETYSFNTRGLSFGSTPVNASASFPARSSHTSVVFENKLWLIGGYDSSINNASNDVWISDDGNNWAQVSQTSSFPARTAHTSVVFNNEIWVIGGFSSNVDKNDVWRSSNGVTWNEVTQATPFPIRSDHTSVVFDNKIWVIGGKLSGFVKNDVWWSEDGSNWTQATAAAPFSARSYHTSVVLNNKLWVIGGSDGQTKNDVWFSSDGNSWAQAAAPADFSSRFSHTSVVFDNKLWVIGGGNGNYFNDIWYSSDGATWIEAITSAPFSERLSHSSLVFNNKIWIIGGRDQSAAIFKNDVWAFD